MTCENLPFVERTPRERMRAWPTSRRSTARVAFSMTTPRVSEYLRHHPREGRELKRAIHFSIDGPCELYGALCAITHARTFLGTMPVLMTMLPSFGKSRFEIAFVCPKFDGSYQEREARNAMVPRNRWVENLTSQAALHALRPDGKSFFNDDNMELCVRCNSGHSRYVELEAIGKTLVEEHLGRTIIRLAQRIQAS